METKDVTEGLLDKITFDLGWAGTYFGNRGDKRVTYCADFFTMDIESSTIKHKGQDPIAFAYTITVYIAGNAIMFRTWKEYKNFLSRLTDLMELNEYRRLVCYVHNLPYEFQFMRSFFEVEELFATQKRKVVKFLSDGIEYRCSYKMTNMNLDKLTSSLPGIQHGKLDGEEFDYKKLRLPSTEITPKEGDYIFNDVVGLYECIDFKLKNENYNIATIPLTSTGFVRNKLRRAMNENPENRANMKQCRLDQLTYGLLRDARRGGNTHCSPIWSCQELSDIYSMDMSSAYPAVMIQCKFPSTKFIPIKDPQRFEEYVGKYACILDLTFTNICVKTLSTVAYIPKAKCTQLRNINGDNGRVLSADKISMVLTDIDYKIIKDTYDFDKYVECRYCYISEYDYLPDELRKLLLKQYYDKTTLKDKDEYLYMKKKNEFNANFGCMLTDICQDSIEYIPGSDGDPFKPIKVKDYSASLDKYYKNPSSFLQYQHGVWVTAHCRNRLQKAIQGLGRDMVYCDTDSAKFFSSPANRLLFDRLNDEIRQEIASCGLNCTVTYKDKDYTLGIWEEDGHYKKFKSLGAKKYAYVNNKDLKGNTVNYDVFHITVAGLSKSKARDYLDRKGGMKVFKPGTKVPPKWSGRTAAHYNDWADPRLIEVNGELVEVGANVAIIDDPYTFGITEDYEYLLIGIGDAEIW